MRGSNSNFRVACLWFQGWGLGVRDGGAETGLLCQVEGFGRRVEDSVDQERGFGLGA